VVTYSYSSSAHQSSSLFEIARVLVRLDHVASLILNASHCLRRFLRGAPLGSDRRPRGRSLEPRIDAASI